MGCDIHSVLQVRENDVSWKTIALDIFGTTRCYDFFNFLGNESRGEDLKEIRLPLIGLPEDIDVKRDENGCDLKINHESDWFPLSPSAYDKTSSFFYLGEHTFNHISLKNLNSVYRSLKEDEHPSIDHSLSVIINTSEYLVKCLTNIHEWYKPYNEWAENVRFIYGMDN